MTIRHSNSCSSGSLEPEIIKMCLSSHKMYSNNLLNFQVSMTILNACTKKSLETHWMHHVCQNVIHFIFLCFNYSPFLNYCKVVVLLFKILFKFSRFNFNSFDSICSWMFGCAVFGRVGFPFSEVGSLLGIGYFCLLIFDEPSNVLLPCSSFIFKHISVISRSENQPFFITVLTGSARL